MISPMDKPGITNQKLKTCACVVVELGLTFSFL